MATVRYSPWVEMNSLQNQLNKMFEDVLSPTEQKKSGISSYSKVPAAEMIETELALILKLELPGINVDNINIEATAKSVSVSGERKSTNSSENDKVRSEFRYGSFARVVPLPVKIQNTKVTAQYQDGILHLTLPKAEEEKNKVVKVNLVNKDND